jgi:hypothetical protein
MPLFSVHGNEGRLAIYLEEQDAVLDLIEETGNEVHPDYIADLAIYGKMQNLKTEEGFDQIFQTSQQTRSDSFADCKHESDEALNLAEQILITVRAMKETPAPRLEIVK